MVADEEHAGIDEKRSRYHSKESTAKVDGKCIERIVH